MESYADRSRVLTYQGCPRKRYFEYEVPTGGEINGVRLSRLDMNLLLGGCFHRGAEQLLESARLGAGLPQIDVELAVDVALAEFWPKVKSQGLMLEADEDASYVAHEQAALLEALIRAYAIYVLPQVLDRFQVVEVEQEEIGRFEAPGFTLKFGARLDALLMEKDTLNLYVLSLKTAKEWGKKDDETARHDMQGLSESRVVEQKLGRWHKFMGAQAEVLTSTVPKWFQDRYSVGAPPIVSGVIMQYALKGRRGAEPYGSGKYKFSNPLIRPWKKASDLGGAEYAFKYEYQDPYGANHRLGKGWNRVNIWEDMGVKAWVEYLSKNEMQGFPPGRALEGQFVLPVEYFRNSEDADRWERQIVAQEKRIAEGLKGFHTNPLTPTGVEAKLDEHFPMHTRSCDWPTKCSFQDICFGPKAYLHAPLSAGLYEIRTANHPTELDPLELA